jgi:hypothetical protein
MWQGVSKIRENRLESPNFIFCLRKHKVQFLLCWVGIHCGIYKYSYNISNTSYLNSLPPSFYFISLSRHSWNSFDRYHFSVYIHAHTVLALYLPSHALSKRPTPSHCTNPLLGGPVMLFCFPIL